MEWVVQGVSTGGHICWGLATTFPVTSTLESGFLVLGWEKDECRKMLSDLSLEGILQAKQAKGLKKISAVLNKLNT
jgi:hypothetical protein